MKTVYYWGPSVQCLAALRRENTAIGEFLERAYTGPEQVAGDIVSFQMKDGTQWLADYAEFRVAHRETHFEAEGEMRRLVLETRSPHTVEKQLAIVESLLSAHDFVWAKD